MRPAKEIADEIVSGWQETYRQEDLAMDDLISNFAAAIEKDRSERDCGSHHWFKYNDMDCCKKCGNVRRADDKNSRCRGKVNIELRPAPTAPAFPSEEEARCEATRAPGAYPDHHADARGFLRCYRWVKARMRSGT